MTLPLCPAVSLGLDGFMQEANIPFVEALAVNPDKLRGQRFAHYLNMPDAAALNAFIARSLKDRSGAQDADLDVTFVAVHACLELKVRPDRNEAGYLNGFIAQADKVSKISLAELSALKNREMRLRIALENAEQAVWDTQNIDDSHYVSDTWYRMRGFELDQTNEIKGRDWQKSLHPDDKKVIEDAYLEQSKGLSDSVNYQYRQRHRTGRWMWILSRGKVVSRDENGLPLRLIGTDTDVTEIRQIEAQATSLADRLRISLSVSGAGLWEYLIETDTVEWDARMCEIYGIKYEDRHQERLGWLEYVHPDDRDDVQTHSEQITLDQTVFAMDYRIIRPSGEIRHIRNRATYIDHKDGRGPRFLGVNLDITEDALRSQELEKARAAMEYESRHDALTGLPNRRRFDEVHAAMIADADSCAYAILHVDLDRFKQINDTFGHTVGDGVLVRTGQVLRDVIGDDGLVSRIGGDEFVILVTADLTDAELTALAREMIERCDQPYMIEGQSCAFGLSVGIARSTDPCRQSSVFARADLALYEAKAQGGQTVRIFGKEMLLAARAGRVAAERFTAALTNDEFICHYQPQFDAKTHKLVALEALVRWQCPERGLLTPDQFLPTATAEGLVSKLDHLVLKKALADRAVWEQMGLCVPRISVNASDARMCDAALLDQLTDLDIPKGAIAFELLETAFADMDTAMTNLAGLKSLGIEVEMDDFGTGRSSVLAFLEIAPKRVKIDQALIVPIVKSQEHRKIVSAMIEIAATRQAEIIAVGVETLAHGDLLAVMGCDILQGYGFAHPMPSGEVPPLLKSKQ